MDVQIMLLIAFYYTDAILAENTFDETKYIAGKYKNLMFQPSSFSGFR